MVVTVAVRLKGNDEAVWVLLLLQILLIFVLLLLLLLNKRKGDILAAVMVTLLLTRLRANEGAIRAHEPNVCLGIACERKIDGDVFIKLAAALEMASKPPLTPAAILGKLKVVA